MKVFQFLKIGRKWFVKKKKIKSVIVTATFLTTIILSFNINSISVKAQEKILTNQMFTKAIIDWRYKVEDGKLYRRQYNYTEQCWIGEWELCP